MNKNTRAFAITINRLLETGEGIGQHQGMDVVVPFSVPGDRLVVRPVKETTRLIRAETVRIVRPGSGRIVPACPHFGKCSGCTWQHIEYSRQIEAKREILEGIFYRRLRQPTSLPVFMHASAHPFAYRSYARVRLRGVGPEASIGFSRWGSRAIENVELCPLFRPALSEALTMVRQFRNKVDTDPREQEMDIACSEEDTWATARVGAGPDAGGSVLWGRKEDVLLRRSIGDCIYATTASAFGLPNDFVFTDIIGQVQEWAGCSGLGSVLNLFAGAGFFSLPLARRAESVTAVDSSPAFSRLCSRNASSAGLKNVRAVCADNAQWMQSAVSAQERYDLVIASPPECGAGLQIMDQIAGLAPKIFIYVSGNPQAIVKDLRRVRGYRADQVAGFDSAPQTPVFGTVVRMVC
jgi:23S rRNA (uracil1939-C5)-methyltransferase